MSLFQYPKTKAEETRHITILLFLTAVSGIFFIDKPFHVDDPHWQDLGNRFFDIKHFYSLPYYIFGERLENIFSAPHPPLVSLFHYTVIRLFPNPSETIFHSVFLGFSMLAVTFVYQFCLRFSRYPFFIALCVLFSPPFFILSQSLMTDTALCGFLWGSFVFFIRAVDRENKGALAAAVALFALAIGVGFQAVVFYAAFFLYCFFNPPRRFSYFFVMGLSALPVLVWFAYHFIQMEQWPSPIDTSILDPLGLRAKLLYFISQLSLAFLAPIGLIIAIVNKKHVKTALAVAVVAGLIFGSLQEGVLVDYSAPQRWVLYVSGFFTIFFLACVLANVFKLPQETDPEGRNDFLFLSLTALIFLPICAAFTPFAASRYLLPIVPFVYVLIPRMTAKLRPAPAAITLIVCIVSSFLVARADYDLASFYKRLPEDAAKLMPEKSRVWFNGEWGFRHYMERTGYRYLTKDADLKERDFIIEPSIPARMALSAIKVPLRLKRELAYPGNRIKTLHHQAHAGFWS
ncbi:MAG: glycosyltransferase family 39 protein, partial [Nitrospinales bacterium]